ncbi:uncharacterized protein G6M90_00g068070 [Metarhizium brunneum]|uniref:Uncharacterized protein n=1 Tax=Metarhizium brunneum TaxID=500148 RepID=A0A7D5YUQ7_9HYPO|nr:hypothetical protein G6M90_00g068070 [Metarhizium brunneum]
MPQNGENYTSVDECLGSRNINPDDLGGHPILNDEYAVRSDTLPGKRREDTLLRANKGLVTALEKLKAALSPELLENLDANIRDTKEMLGVPGVDIQAIVDSFRKLRD